MPVSSECVIGEGRYLLGYNSRAFTFTRFDEKPMGWSFDVSTVSYAFVVNYGIESIWVAGMPANPCY